MHLTVGDKAPNFQLPDQNGKIRSLSDNLGKKVLVYFYPRDFTQGCTTEACSLRDSFPNIKNLNAVILGISKDSIQSHKKFAQKFNLPFILLADIDHKVQEKYGVWQQKKFLGKTYMGTIRTSFLIDQNAKILKIYEKVKPQVHVYEVLDDLKSQ